MGFRESIRGSDAEGVLVINMSEEIEEDKVPEFKMKIPDNFNPWLAMEKLKEEDPAKYERVKKMLAQREQRLVRNKKEEEEE